MSDEHPRPAATSVRRFGLGADEVAARKQAGHRPGEDLARDPELAAALAAISDGTFSDGDRALYAGFVRDLGERDPFLVLADYRAYVECQARVSAAWRSSAGWLRSSILNVARAGRFSSDRAIREYAAGIWNVSPVALGEDGHPRP